MFVCMYTYIDASLQLFEMYYEQEEGCYSKKCKITKNLKAFSVSDHFFYLQCQQALKNLHNYLNSCTYKYQLN